jgi:hypothetical protein
LAADSAASLFASILSISLSWATLRQSSHTFLGDPPLLATSGGRAGRTFPHRQSLTVVVAVGLAIFAPSMVI